MPDHGRSASNGPSLPNAVLDALVLEHRQRTLPRLRKLWRYYRNECRPTAEGHGVFPQEEGLPDRLRRSPDGEPRREIVIENDIAWRMHTQVDFMFGRPVEVRSLADDPAQAERIDALIAEVFRAAGGVTFFQDLALLGAVYGSADILVRCEPDRTDPAMGFSLELIEARRAIPVLNAGDYRQLDAYIIRTHKRTFETDADSRPGRTARSARPTTQERLECWTADRREMLASDEGTGAERRLRRREPNPLGHVPVVHIQNLPQPFAYHGLSDVEPLIPLQDELNTRLSDRANRVTFACFKMYLAKGLEGFTERPVGPGQMWATDNPEASIESFGGDSDTPTEDAHIEQVREALDKASGVSPIAAGVLRGRVGNLTSENAVRVVLLGLLARTEKKRITYGAGIERCCQLILHAADVHGLLPNRLEDRRFRIDWPDPFPESRSMQLDNAERKVRLGVPQEQVLTELGYADCPPHLADEPHTKPADGNTGEAAAHNAV